MKKNFYACELKPGVEAELREKFWKKGEQPSSQWLKTRVKERTEVMSESEAIALKKKQNDKSV